MPCPQQRSKLSGIFDIDHIFSFNFYHPVQCGVMLDAATYHTENAPAISQKPAYFSLFSATSAFSTSGDGLNLGVRRALGDVSSRADLPCWLILNSNFSFGTTGTFNTR